MEKRFSKFAEALSHLLPRTMKSFSAREALKFGWQTMKENFWFFVGLYMVVGLIFIGPDILVGISFEEEGQTLALWVSILGNILGIVVSLGLLKISLNFCDNLKSKIIDLFSQYRLFFKFLFASILYNLIVILGLILLVLPGIYFGVRLQFYGYLIIDKQTRIIESLKRSWQITQGSFWNLLFLNVLLVLINLAGFALLVVGLFVTKPITIVARAFVYRKLAPSFIAPAPARPVMNPSST